MAQYQLPLFPEGSTQITADLCFEKQKGRITYFYGSLPIFTHDETDSATFRMITSQFYMTGYVKQADIVRVFGVTKISIKRSVALFKAKGVKGFYEARKTRGAAVLIEPVIKKAQGLLDEGLDVKEVAEQLELKRDTLAKAIKSEKLHQRVKKKESKALSSAVVTKSERSQQDNLADMGVATTDKLNRMATSLGELTEAPIQFQSCQDVPHAGVLVALPTLLVFGLLEHLEDHFKLPKGYYGLQSIFLLLAFMALARFKTVDSLRFSPPGEWGKLLGLDRAPEARTLREKLHHLSKGTKPVEWMADLCKRWMAQAPDDSAVLYCDGHVRVYHGNQTKLPKHHVSRQKLCLRATTDYWINAMDGQPFLVVNKAVDPGLIKVLEEEIVPELEKLRPRDATNEDTINQDLLQHRFTLVFDREGYSPAFLLRMKKKKIACITYHKFPDDPWPEEEFSKRSITLTSGLTTTDQFAERGTFLSQKLWVREIRKLTSSGHQVSVISTQYHGDAVSIAANLFGRWSQENYFKYMLENYGLDRLVGYGLDDIPETTMVVNPQYRALDSQVRSENAKLSRKSASFAQLSLLDEIEPTKVEIYQQKKAVLLEEIKSQEEQIDALKEQRRELKKHIEFRELPKDEQFKALASDSKYLVDTIKMIAYRSETALQQILQEKIQKKDQARQLAKAIYQSSADLIPDHAEGTLTIHLHHQANKGTNQVIESLCLELNKTETIFPGTNLKLIYKLGSN